eukprot:gnl/TRDRNA2_/TRDRNA2_138985_c0_seq1.p1 gnl/TRDRNA2_/TRDRNA2_138985_c0~~gnl/TRDRNA2_/TRDRNA2_138985_c0_seq1.p1  ORF type:complete len:301 (-),score=37.44 gnl/TRDRNA2_/TRDRNA2_138985_c0_seq1:102-899(-)
MSSDEARAVVAQMREKRLEDRAPAGWGLESYFGICCLGRPSSAEVTSEERSTLWDLRTHHCNTEFDAESQETKRILSELWAAVFPDDPMSEVQRDDRWKKLGFQSATPWTDVRSGRLALDQMHHFATKYPERMQQLVSQAETLDYPLAITCFNMTHLVLVFFDLYNGETVSPVQGAEQATRMQLKHFASLCRLVPTSQGGCRGVLDELVVALVEKLHEIWKDMRASENVNLMDFPKAMRKVFDVHAHFWHSQHKELAELRDILRV